MNSYCITLESFKIVKYCFRPMPSFRGFTNLLSLDLDAVTFESHKSGEFLTRGPLLEILKLVIIVLLQKRDDVMTLENLKVLSLALCKLDNTARMTSSNIFRLMGSFPKLWELTLDFYIRKVRFS